MKIKIKNLGPLKQAEFELANMTIICGGNNTGKTYATYALFGFLRSWRRIFSIDIDESIPDKLLSEGTVRIDLSQYINNSKDIIRKGCNAYSRYLSMVFASNKERFKDTDFQIVLDSDDIGISKEYKKVLSTANETELFYITKAKDGKELEISLLVEKESVNERANITVKFIRTSIENAIKNILFEHLFPSPFIASAERTGAAIFRKELDFARNRLLEEMAQNNKNIDPIELLFKSYQDYALPVKENVDFTRKLEELSKKESVIAKEHGEMLKEFSNIIGGKYTVTRNDELFFVPKGKKIKLTMDESSSAVRSLLDVGFYLKHIADYGDFLMIDEPELNLHPENQRRVARLLARLVNIGVNVFITTHSDYIIKEINTLIMLNDDKTHIKEIRDREKYVSEELLSPEKINVYIAKKDKILLEGNERKSYNLTLMPAEINSEFGAEVESFDETIDKMNEIQEAIVWGGQ